MAQELADNADTPLTEEHITTAAQMLKAKLTTRVADIHQALLQKAKPKASFSVDTQADTLNNALRSLNRTLSNVNPQSVLDSHIERGAQAITTVLPQVQATITEAKRAAPQGLGGEKLREFIQRFITHKLGAIPLGPTSHTLRMLGAPMQMLKVDTGILYKIFFNESKHASEMENVTPENLVRQLYEPTLVLNGGKGQFDLVLDIQGEKGPLLVPIKTDVGLSLTSAGKVSTVLTAFGKPIMGGPESIGSRILKGDVVYADMGVGRTAPETESSSSRGEGVAALDTGASGLKAESRQSKNKKQDGQSRG